jgi:hypothetical protein
MSVCTAALPPEEDCVLCGVAVALADGVAVAVGPVDEGWPVDGVWAAAVTLAGADGAAFGRAADWGDRLARGLADEATAPLAVLAARIMADAAESTPSTLTPTWLALLRLTGSDRSAESRLACGWPAGATRP